MFASRQLIPARLVQSFLKRRTCANWTMMSRAQHTGGGAQPLPDGVFPTMITPFLNDGDKSVDWAGLDLLTEWYIKSGVAGIFSICLSSEMFQLSNEERLDIAKRVVTKTAGRVPVVAGATFEGSLEEQAQFMNEMGKIVNTVVIITNQIASMEEGDDVWVANCKQLMALTGDIPLGFYETPVPQVRSLTPDILRWAAETGRFTFHKDTSLSVGRMVEKIQALKSVGGSPFKFYTAKTQFVKACVDNGGNGFSGVFPNFQPWLMVWMCRERSAAEEKRERMQRFLSVMDRVFEHKYPTSSKFYLNKFYGAPIQPVSRVFDVSLNDKDELSFAAAKLMMEEVCRDFGITPVVP